MKFQRALILVPALLLAGTATASEELFKKSGCVACHKVDQKLVGPALKDVAKKYAGQAGAADALAKKVRAGGTGVWGSVPMPPAPTTVNDADLKAAIEWVLSLK